MVFAGWLVFYYYQSLTHILGCNVLKINIYSHSDITTATLLDHYYPNTIVYILLVLMADTLFLCFPQVAAAPPTLHTEVEESG